MTSATSPRTSQFFDRYAATFNDIYGNRNGILNSVVNGLFRRSMKLRYLRTLSGCSPIEGRTVIDIGCGPGHYSVELAARGASGVHGIDFAPEMLELARERARRAGVDARCTFEQVDFQVLPSKTRYDYSVVMGFMDYVSKPREAIEKVISLTSSKAFFSFPASGGLLAWQRRLRYRKRCDLFLYDETQIVALFDGLPCRMRMERIDRDYFVTATRI